MKFLRKTKLCDLAPINPEDINNSIKGIKRTISRIQRRTYRSNNAKYVFKREENIERLQVIMLDLKNLIKQKE